jgi:hypothetical protein
LKNESKKPGLSHKLQKEFLGPYKVIEILSDHSVKLRNENNQKILKYPVHVDRLKPVVPRDQRDLSVSSDEEDNIDAGVNGVSPQQGGTTHLGERVANSTSNVRSQPLSTPDPPSVTTTVPDVQPTDVEASGTSASSGIAQRNRLRSPTTHITDNVFEIERIVKARGSGDKRMYLVRWKKSPGDKFKDSWVAARDVTQFAIDKFNERIAASRKQPRQRC